MLITPPIGMTTINIDTESDNNATRYLRIRYAGRKSDVLSDPFKVQIWTRRPQQPTITADNIDVTPGFGITATGSAFDSKVIGDEHLSTAWRISTDPEGLNVVDIPFTETDPQKIRVDDLIDRPTNDYYISVRYEGHHGFSDWAEPVKVRWTNWDVPADYWQNQITMFDQIKSVYDAAAKANIGVSWFQARTATLRMDNIQLFDLPLRTTSFGVKVGGKDPNWSDMIAATIVTGPWNNPQGRTAHGDTCWLSIVPTTQIFNTNKKGCILASSTVPNRQYFDLTKTNGKIVTIIKDTNLGEFYLAMNLSNYTMTAYIVKKVRAVTSRPNVTGTLMVV